MDQRVSLVTLVVDDPDAERAFDEALGRDATDQGGTTAFFATPEGHLWEVAHNRSAPLADDGRSRWRGYAGDDQ